MPVPFALLAVAAHLVRPGPGNPRIPGPQLPPHPRRLLSAGVRGQRAGALRRRRHAPPGAGGCLLYRRHRNDQCPVRPFSQGHRPPGAPLLAGPEPQWPQPAGGGGELGRRRGLLPLAHPGDRRAAPSAHRGPVGGRGPGRPHRPALSLGGGGPGRGRGLSGQFAP